MSTHASLRRGLIGTLVAGLVATPLAVGLTAAPAQAASTGLVISEVYGGGGNSNATYNQDFVEIYNPTANSINVASMSVQYRSATGAANPSGVAELTGSVGPGARYLVGLATGATGAPLPVRPDVTAAGVNLSGSAGTVFLVNQAGALTSPPTGSVLNNPAIVDLVGYGTSNTFETTAAAAPTNNGQSLNRAAGDTDVNASDFALSAPSPQGGTAVQPDPNPEPTNVAIAEIQGTGTSSPRVGDTVTTTGVITALYPGTFNGFYLQTGGTGGATDATPGASDALFVFAGSSFTNAAGLAVGDSVEVTGAVSEFNGSTQITAIGDAVTELATPLGAVTPAAIAYPTTTEGREAHEGELLAPTDRFTVTNVFGTNRYAEIGLATGDRPLVQPTEVGAAGTPEHDAQVADNAARAVTLDDGASIDFLPFGGGDNQDIPLPWLTRERSIRVDARATLVAPVILDFRNSTWKFQPTQQVTGAGAEVATFEDTRAANLAPRPVGGNIQLGTFNVLNYFPVTGSVWESRGNTCTYFEDRDGDPVGVNSCSNNGPRGAAELGDFRRQQAKIVRAINTMDADVVSLEEIENSVKVGETDRDSGVRKLVAALNADAGNRRWAFVPSPAAADLPPLASQDVIRTAFIFKPSVVSPVGASRVLLNSTAFTNARQPLAQAFKPAGASDESAFAVVVNHFKSKSNSNPVATGDNANGPQGAFNGDRTRQAQALADFAKQFATDRGTDAVFLTGDFNAYSKEDPVKKLEDNGFNLVKSTEPGDYSYSFSGLSGSLDHVFGNAAAVDMVTGADIWEINANESVAYQYSRRNYNATQFFDGSEPFAASDHNPEIVGLTAPNVGKEVQILATNDFHGRLLANGAEAGAAVFSGAVKQLRAENPNTVFSAAGDLIGASTFESFIQKDEPTIDVLNEAGLEVSAVGNHEFDAGYEDLVGRVQGRANWEYLAANVVEPDGRDELAETWVRDFDGVQVGFVGAVTEDLPTLVSPAGIQGVQVTDIVTATNAAAAQLRAAGADAVILLVHEGAPSTNIADAVDPANNFGAIVNGVSADVDAIVSGHTHLAYNHSVPVPAWVAQGRAVTERPVVSAGQYGTNLNKLVFQFDTDGEIVAKAQELLPLATDVDGAGPGNVFAANYPVDASTKTIVDAAVAVASVEGAKKLGEIAAPFRRAALANGTTENRGGESTLGNLVAEIQRWATSTPEAGAAEIAFMNPGGLRANLDGTGTNPRSVTFRQAANVQPFANTLVNMELTGAQLESVLEEQWQPTGAPRPFLKLGVSKGFTYTYTPPAAGAPAGTKGEVTGMWLDGEPVGDNEAYSVTVNSFLASGGDAFSTFAGVTGKRDTGKSDLQAQVDYFAEYANTAQGDAPLAVDYSQRGVGVAFPEAAPSTYEPGDEVTFTLSSLSMTALDDVRDASLSVSLGGVTLGAADVATVVQTALPGFDEAGTATVTVTLPSDVAEGVQELVLVGNNTGTRVEVPVTVDVADQPIATTVTGTSADVATGEAAVVAVTVTAAAGPVPTGTVTVLDGTTEVASGELVDGAVDLTVPASALEVGDNVLTLSYAGSTTHLPSTGSVTVTVTEPTPEPATPVITVSHNPSRVLADRTRPQLVVVVRADGAPATGWVEVRTAGRTFARKLQAGRLTLRLPAYNTAGTKSVFVKYGGNATTRARTVAHTIRVVRG